MLYIKYKTFAFLTFREIEHNFLFCQTQTRAYFIYLMDKKQPFPAADFNCSMLHVSSIWKMQFIKDNLYKGILKVTKMINQIWKAENVRNTNGH